MSRVERHAAGVHLMHRCTRCKQNRVQTFRSVELTLQRREGNVKFFITQFTEEKFKIFTKFFSPTCSFAISVLIFGMCRVVNEMQVSCGVLS